jgi:NitT/TauT family transport system ATP-binding protein
VETVKIRVDGLTKRFTHKGGRLVTALDHVSFSVNEGTFWVIVGPSGCGKTTLLRILAGLEEPDGGTAEIPVRRPGRPVSSMVFQEHSVLPWMTVAQNIAYGLRLRHRPRRAQQEAAEHYARMVGLTRFLHAYPHQLSGGMKQRVSIARALAQDPEVLLMDEPFAALDEQNKLLLQQELMRIWEADRKTVLYITHSIDEAISLGDQVMVMTAQPGRIKEIIRIDAPRPRHLTELRASEAYGRLYRRIYEALRDEVLEAKRREGLDLTVT